MQGGKQARGGTPIVLGTILRNGWALPVLVHRAVSWLFTAEYVLLKRLT